MRKSIAVSYFERDRSGSSDVIVARRVDYVCACPDSCRIFVSKYNKMLLAERPGSEISYMCATKDEKIMMFSLQSGCKAKNDTITYVSTSQTSL